MPPTEVHYDEHGRAEVPSRRILRIVLIVIAILVVIWIIGFLVGYALFNLGGEVPGTGTGDVITTP